RFHQHVLGIRKSGIHRYLETNANDEIGQLIGAHNEMLNHIETLMAENEQVVQEMRRLEISALQSQIKPHFLYNTLEAVSWMAKMNQPERIQSTLRSLTGFYRMCLSHGKDVLTVAEELDIVRNYFTVQSIRYAQEFLLETTVDDAMLSNRLPKITLQPLVENALLHGILESGKSGGTIRIFNRKTEGGQDELCVADSGAHFTQEDFLIALSDCNETGEGYGLHNVERRLELFFKADQVMYLDTSDSDYSIVVLRFYP
ncbi:MAG: histidine kinase, partial [Bacillota bacterium]